MKNSNGAITGVNHITFAVRDLDRAWHFYVEVLGMKPVARWYKGAYLLAGDMWLVLTLDETISGALLPEYTHVAFAVSEEGFARMEDKIRTSGAGIWQNNHSEGVSLYFLDPDNHKLEIHCSDLKARIAALREQAPRDLIVYE